jgi:hypothetical protein
MLKGWLAAEGAQFNCKPLLLYDIIAPANPACMLNSQLPLCYYLLSMHVRPYKYWGRRQALPSAWHAAADSLSVVWL